LSVLWLPNLKEKVYPSKEYMYLTQSAFIPWPFYGIVMSWLDMVSLLFLAVLAPAKHALFIPHRLAK